MSGLSAIQWTDATWNPTRGCSVISPGCHHCYAMKQAHRYDKPGLPFDGYTKESPAGAQWSGKVDLVQKQLDWPLRWSGAPHARVESRKSRIFVNSMSDLFHESLKVEDIDSVFAVMALSRWNTFQVLTKRAERLREYSTALTRERLIDRANRAVDGGLVSFGRKNLTTIAYPTARRRFIEGDRDAIGIMSHPPLPNVWLGVSVENRKHGLPRIEILRNTPAAVRFLSIEPLIEDLGTIDLTGIHWVIVGGESGPRSRPFDLTWARSLRDQCAAVGVPFFLKQLGAYPWDSSENYFDNETVSSKGGDPSEWPEDLRVRQMPQAA